ncbi:MAG TPA: ATP-binding cassette domain-containing protein, partial [Candidatus Nitrosocosmicus sp.]|nr:ATP-binding cassette domain-containing protein [Candidatus Nitrosocosmicus sp.]
MIEFRDVDYSIDGRPILKGISLAVQAGETRVILGPSGSGKSTTLRLLIGLVKPDRGGIFI